MHSGSILVFAHWARQDFRYCTVSLYQSTFQRLQSFVVSSYSPFTRTSLSHFWIRSQAHISTSNQAWCASSFWSPRHYSVDEIKKTDNVLIATLQTLTRAYKRKQPKLEAFLESANDKVFVVFDEAHHSPSPTYRQLIIAWQERFPKIYLLGLTATPTSSNKYKCGWLEKLLSQRIID